ncbi:hypothetical protein M434DRAFT_27743 [Hypoxylon sp. CO27-5]|nr:hypothetical protein M434DRAFT_27743 [Hypoxylon sp. CO27-5]
MADINEFTSQWKNPSDASTVLMVIGGDIVQKALAQSTGSLFTPVCFSFGWVAYAFTTLLNTIGDGRLLPPPDYPVKVWNLNSGYCRENKNWVIGRIVRDHETSISRQEPLGNNAIRIVVYEADKSPNGPTHFSYGYLHIYGAATMVLQLIVAAIPILLHGEWIVFMITIVGTCLTLIAGALPQWTAEKLPNQQNSCSTYALTSGNGSRDVMVIKGMGQCLDLEELCVSESPRRTRPWSKFSNSSQVFYRMLPRVAGWPKFPLGFWMTRITCLLLSILWLLLLIGVAGIQQDTWFLLVTGAMGMFQNGIVAAVERPFNTRNLFLTKIDTIKTRKVMDGLMDLEVSHSCGRCLVREFFPGKLRPNEDAWWGGYKEPYDRERAKTRSLAGNEAWKANLKG